MKMYSKKDSWGDRLCWGGRLLNDEGRNTGKYWGIGGESLSVLNEEDPSGKPSNGSHAGVSGSGGVFLVGLEKREHAL